MTISPLQSYAIDVARWVAAFLVVLMHLRETLFAKVSDLEAHSVSTKLFYFATGFGSQAVMVFFVISGFLVGGKALADYRRGRFDWSAYFINRFSRIYTVLLGVLVVGAALDWCGYLFFNQAGLYSTSAGDDFLGQAPNTRMGIDAFAINLLSLQTIAGPVFGSNRALWSLANEWWYYLLFPAFLGCFYTTGWRKAGSALAALAVFLLLTSEIRALFVIWLMGVAGALVTMKRTMPRVTAMLFFIVLVGSRFQWPIANDLKFYVLGGVFAVFLANCGGSEATGPLLALSKRLSAFSYSLYALHCPLIFFMVSLLPDAGWAGSNQPGFKTYTAFLAIFAVVVTSSWVFSLVTEEKTPQLRGFMRRFMAFSASSAASR